MHLGPCAGQAQRDSTSIVPRRNCRRRLAYSAENARGGFAFRIRRVWKCLSTLGVAGATDPDDIVRSLRKERNPQ